MLSYKESHVCVLVSVVGCVWCAMVESIMNSLAYLCSRLVIIPSSSSQPPPVIEYNPEHDIHVCDLREYVPFRYYDPEFPSYDKEENLDYGPDYDPESPEDPIEIDLIRAVEQGNTEYVRLLLTCFPNIDPRATAEYSEDGKTTALMMALRKGHTEISNLLLNHSV